MYDLISVGNISIDLYYKGKSFTRNKERFQLAIGGKYYADYFHEDINSAAANVFMKIISIIFSPNRQLKALFISSKRFPLVIEIDTDIANGDKIVHKLI